MKANPGKCHLLLSTKSPEVVFIDGIQITSSTTKTLLGITIDSELNFENQLSRHVTRGEEGARSPLPFFKI